MTARNHRRSFIVLLALTTLALGLVAPLVGTAAAATFSNANSFTIADATCGTGPGDPSVPGKASLYPSNISVSGLTGTLSDVNVVLKNVSHPFDGDLAFLLVGPGGGTLVLVSDAGTAGITNVTLTVDDSAASQLSASGAWGAANSSVSAKPTDYNEAVILPNQPADSYPSPAPSPVNHPANTGSATLASVFNGINPNGTWSLYAIDDGCGDTGSVAGGWSLDISTASAAATTTSVMSSVNPSTTGQSVTFTATVTSGGPVTTGSVTFTEGVTTLAANVGLNGSGQASFSTSALPEGTHVITATYNGTASFASSSGTVTQQVDNATTVNGNTFCNTGAITIPTQGTSTPYPSHITVSGQPTTFGKVTAQVKNVSHPFAEDIDVLLVGPTTTNNLVIVSDAGSGATTNVSVTFDDTAANSVPASGAWAAPNGSATYKPTDYDPLGEVDTFPSPAPAVSSATTLAGAFGGTNPNGTWSLYVVDDGAGDGGSIAGGWCLTFTPPPQADIAVTKGDSPDPVLAGANITYAINVSNSVAGSTAASATLTDNLPAHTTFVSLTNPGWSCTTPAVGATGTVSCSRSSLTPADGTQAFSLVVKVDLQTPTTASPISNTATVSATGDTAASGNNVATATTSVTYAPSLPAVVRQSTNWLLRNTLTTGAADNTFTYGTKPLAPLMGDWNGDGIKTAGTYEAGTFKLRNTNSTGAPDIMFTFGDPSGFPVAGDFNGDGKDDVAVFRAGVWQVYYMGIGAGPTFSFGSGTWPATVPVAGDWNGDGIDGIGTYTLFAPGNIGEWNLRNTADAGIADAGTFVFGSGSQYPVVGDWNGDGVDTVGVKVMAGTTWSLRNSNTAGAANVTIDYGLANDLPETWRNLVPA